MYTVVTPMLNPFIYSLRNKDVKGALGRLLNRAAPCLWWITGPRTKCTLWAPKINVAILTILVLFLSYKTLLISSIQSTDHFSFLCFYISTRWFFSTTPWETSFWFFFPTCCPQCSLFGQHPAAILKICNFKFKTLMRSTADFVSQKVVLIPHWS